MLLRCTQKFLTELRLKKSDIIEASAVAHPLNEWYAHVSLASFACANYYVDLCIIF